ncbi:MAG: Rho-binding antiterminator [Gammaproteobacteria bacterium]|nr:Rho-binding antiterminator [Gammaproteobacteria bacterium]
MSDYTPITCAQHSEYELMAMHRNSVMLRVVGASEDITGTVVDITTRSGCEYMVLLLAGGEKREVRLDLIESVNAV